MITNFSRAYFNLSSESGNKNRNKNKKKISCWKIKMEGIIEENP